MKDTFEFYVIMQKRKDGKIYPDLNKTNGKIYYVREDAEREILFDPSISQYRHVVKMWATLADQQSDGEG